MATEENVVEEPKGLGIFEKYLTIWVGLCIAGGIGLGKVAPGLAKGLDVMLKGAPVSELLFLEEAKK